jgi:hypothetical protein
VIARLRSSVRSLLYQRRDLHQSTYLYLSKDREPTSHQCLSVTPPPPSLPSSDPRLWRQRVSRWGDSLEASVALLPLSLLHLRMTTFGQARRFTAPSYGDVEDQRQVPPWRSRQPSRPGCLGCSPPPLAIRHLDYLGRLMWSLVVGYLG